jgi:N-acyl-D-aspartate/D-glutamate deacylase
VTEVQLVSPGAMSLLAGATWVLFGTGVRSGAGAVTDAGADLTRVVGPLVRDAGRLPLRHATSRLTSAPAHAFNLPGRGRLQAGTFADVVVFDPATIGGPPAPGATGAAAIPAVRYVLVNGVMVTTPKGPTGARPGRVLTR